MPNELNKKCQLNWSEQTGYLLNTYTDDPEEAVALMEQLKRELGLEGELVKEESEETPLCPTCETPMVKRTGVKGEFWGCSNFPKCKGTRQV